MLIFPSWKHDKNWWKSIAKIAKSLRASGRCPEPRSLPSARPRELLRGSTPFVRAHPPLQPRHWIISIVPFWPRARKKSLDWWSSSTDKVISSRVEWYTDLTQLQMDWEEERVFHLSKNIFAMDLANILHAEDRFFCSAQKFFCYQTMFGTKHSLLYDVWLLSNNST